MVPAPPWWTTALTRGKSQSCGTLSRKNIFSGMFSEERPPQPFEMRARVSGSLERAVRRVFVRFVGSEITMEPKPM